MKKLFLVLFASFAFLFLFSGMAKAVDFTYNSQEILVNFTVPWLQKNADKAAEDACRQSTNNTWPTYISVAPELNADGSQKIVGIANQDIYYICYLRAPQLPPTPPLNLPTTSGSSGGQCNESGNGETIGSSNYKSAVQINFSNGLVPCGKSSLNRYAYSITTNATQTTDNTIYNAYHAIGGPAWTDAYCQQNCLDYVNNRISLKDFILANGTSISSDNSWAAGITVRCMCKWQYNRILTTTGGQSGNGVIAAKDATDATNQFNIIRNDTANVASSNLNTTPVSTGLFCPCQLSHIFVLALNLYNFALWYMALPLAGLLILIGGLLMALSGINASWYNTGKNILWGTAIAIALIFGSWLIIDIVLKTIGYPLQWNIF